MFCGSNIRTSPAISPAVYVVYVMDYIACVNSYFCNIAEWLCLKGFDFTYDFSWCIYD